MVIMKDNGWKMEKDVVDVLVFVELWVGGLATKSSSIENGFMVCITSRELKLRSDPKRSTCDSPPLSEIMSFSKMLPSILLSVLLSMTCEM